MATMIDNARSTSTILQDMRKVDMLDVSLLNPNKSPLIALMTRLNKRVAINPEYKHIERDIAPALDTLNGAVAGIDTDIVVDNGDYFNAGDVVEINDGSNLEVVLVTSVSTDTLTVTRDINNDGAQDFADAVEVQIIGSARAEGADARDAKSTKGTKVTNYTQIFSDTFGVTNTEKNSEMFGGSDLAQQRKEAGITHSVKMERAALFGNKRETTDANGDRIRFTGGILEAIAGGDGRIVNGGGALTESEFEGFLRTSIENDPDATRVIFISRLVAQVISGWARDKIQTVSKDKTYGININKYISPMGDFNLIQHPLLTGDVYGGYAINVVLKECLYRPLQNRDTQLRTNIQSKLSDKELDEYITEAGFQWKHADKHTVLKGVTG